MEYGDYILVDNYFGAVKAEKKDYSLGQDLLKSAPPELKNGFFVSYLEFYDLQHSLQQGTMSSLTESL